MKWSKVAVAVWAVWLVVFIAVEAIGLRVSNDGWMSLTQWFRRYVPWWVAVPLTGWLFYHAVVTYLRPAP